MSKNINKILLLFTGGTIAMVRKRDGSLKPSKSVEELLSLLPELDQLSAFDYEYITNIDSSNMHPGIWTKLAQAIYKNYDKYNGFVVIHGTDTMAYSATALSFVFQNLNKPIVFTGSQKPIVDIGSDGRNNLINAIKVANMDIPEVCIVFATEILRGNRTEKRSEVKLNTFWSPVAMQLGTINIKPEIFSERIFKWKSKELIFKPNFEKNIMLFNLFPGINSKYIEQTINNGCKGIILSSFGAGNIPNKNNSLIPLVKKAYKAKIPVIITSQCVEGSAQLYMYEGGFAAKKFGAISGLDMTNEAAIAKLMWVLAQTNDFEEIRELIQTNVAGEISTVQ